MNDWAEIRKNCVVWEDPAALVLNKPAEITLVGDRSDTDLMALVKSAGEHLTAVHRIDKVTSGAVLLAKEPEIHATLTRQFNRHSVDKAYLSITRSRGLPDRGTIDLAFSAGRKGRVRVAGLREDIAFDEATSSWSLPPAKVFTHTKTYPSVTTFAKVWEGGDFTLLAIRPFTGRRNQIRVHLAWIGHPIKGDPLFPRVGDERSERTYLHSWRLAFDAEWADGERVEVEAALPDDFWAPLREHLPDDGAVTVLQSAREAIGELIHSAS
jgi:tRNA pseudouridine32 synthase/23S rRNA pseudouridine746 synthase